MAVLGTVSKQPREKIDFDLVYTDTLANRSDTLSLSITEVAPPTNLTVEYSQISGDIVKVKVVGGTSGVTYVVTVMTTTTNGFLYEDEVNVEVLET